MQRKGPMSTTGWNLKWLQRQSLMPQHYMWMTLIGQYPSITIRHLAYTTAKAAKAVWHTCQVYHNTTSVIWCSRTMGDSWNTVNSIFPHSPDGSNSHGGPTVLPAISCWITKLHDRRPFSETSRETTTDFLRDNFYSKPVSSMDKPTTSRHYGSWTLKELKLELMARKAKRTGKKADLVKRWVGDNLDVWSVCLH